MLDILCIERGRIFDTYKVTGDIHAYTNSEIADKCDRNNWGYSVVYRRGNEMVIKIDKD